MRTLLVTLLALLISSSEVFAEKTYTEKEFNEKLEQGIKERIAVLKKKSLTQLTQDLIDKEIKLEKREETLNQREEQLEISEKTLLKKIEELESDKKRILGCISENERTERMRITQLVSVISNMKPQKAADLLSVQDAGISIKILEKINPERASKIFNLMDKEVSARLQKQYLNMQK